MRYLLFVLLFLFGGHFGGPPNARLPLDFGDAAPVLMTEKDAVKLRHAARDNWWVLPVSAELEPAFGEWLTRRLDGFRRRSPAA